MQIHELNDFVGALGDNTFLAIDNGTDTSKISKTELFRSTEERIDNIISGPAPSAAEVMDARIGANGVTYNTLGAAIRSQIESDFALASAIASVIPNGTNYNTLTSPGNYRVGSASAAQSMTNCPTTAAHRLFVMEIFPNRIIQIVFVNSSTTSIFMRYYGGSSWGAWNSIAFAKDENAIVRIDQENINNITSNTDYDTITTVGAYEVRGSAVAKTLVNCPVQSAHRLYVTKLYTGSSNTYQIVITSDTRMTQYIRRKTSSGTWTEWVTSDNPPTAQYTALYNEFNNEFSLNVSRIKFGGTATYSTLPIETGVAGTTDCYGIGDAIDSVLYSSVWRDGLDVYRNLTLETFYSALANPASVLYTKDYIDKNISNAHSWYGGVCSTYVTKILGLRQYKTTAQLDDYFEPKPILDYHDVAVGDALLMTGHIAFISQIYIDSDGALNGFGISEQTGSMFRTSIVDVKNFDAYLKRRGYTVMSLINPMPPVTLDDPRFNSEIIFEKGNNTYITADDIADGAWFYIPNAETVYYSKNEGAFASVTVASLPSKTVNGVTVYNLGSCFSGVGDYVFTEDENAIKKCLIKLISLGTINLTGNTITLSGWDNCTPYNYYIVKEFVRTSPDQGYAMDPTPGYVCLYTNDCGDIDVTQGATSVTVTIPAAYLAGLDRYKVWLEYDTGIGYKQAFTNLVVV